MKRVLLGLGSLLLVSTLRAQEFVAVVITPVEGDNYNIDLGNADLVKFQPTCYQQPGCQDEDGYSYVIDSIVARPGKPRVLLYLGSYAGYTATIRHEVFDWAVSPENKIACPDYHDMVIPLANHTIELYYDVVTDVWRVVQ